MAQAREELSALPIRMGEGIDCTIEEIGRLCLEPATQPGLVVVDSFDRLDVGDESSAEA